MSHSDKIEGDTIADVIAALIEDNTLIRIKTVNGAEEGIGIINSQRAIAKNTYFQIEMPESISFPENSDEWAAELTFDFMGRDRLNYRFTATGGIIMGDKLWVRLPTHIERIQQRNNFRIEAPKKSLLEVTLEAKRYHLILENISLGGAFCRARRSLKAGLEHLPVKEDTRLEELRLVVPMDGKPAEIYVQRCRVARIVKDPDKRLLGYGIEFLEMSRQEKTHLTRIIYELQRRFLKHRLR
jgi:c-di-GMP-binding flagellar brake protein YcgR